MTSLFGKSEKPKIIIVSKDFSGLGWAKMSLDAGYETILVYKNDEVETEDEAAFNMVGDNIVEKMELDEIFEKRAKYKTAYWIFDQNFHSDYSEKLRKEGFKVFGASELMEKAEHDRDFGVSLVEKAGLSTPETKQFADMASGIEFLEQNVDKAYVFKPDEPDEKAWVTTVPDNDRDDKANEEIRQFLNSMGDGQGEYILQERKKGIEINVEIWLYKGRPFFTHGNFECKRKLNKDLGRLIGCSHDIEFTIPIDCKIVQDTLAKLIQLPEFSDYTGFVDMNLIVADKEYFFLEFCCRYGYSSHPNLFINLAIKSFPEIMVKFMDGDIKNFYDYFRDGFGSTILMSIDNPVMGLPLIIPEELQNKFYHYDSYLNENGEYCLAGYSQEVGIICGFDYDLKSAADDVLLNFDKIHYPGRGGRTDINLTNYDNNPWERWIGATAMKLFDRKI